jgi:sigma-B regulation protein RsbU (phosphoserine phosphatase)
METRSSRRSKDSASKYKVRRILSITTAINENQKADALFAVLRDILLKDLEIEHVAFLAHIDDSWKCVIKEGLENWTCDFDVQEELGEITDITSLGMANNSKLDFFDLVIPVMHKEKALGYLFLKDIEEEVSGVSNLIKNLNYIQSLANIIMVALENKRMAKEQLKQVAFQRELELAERIQKALLPSSLPYNQNIKATAYHQSHGHVGGDYYDLIETLPGVYYFCMADISGKGVSAALLMSNFQAAFKAIVRQNSSLYEIVQQLNQTVMDSSNGEKFITLFLGKYDASTRELEYVNCAHPPAILFNSQATLELAPTIPGLGMIEKLPPFEPESYTFHESTFLTCYTDGVSEIENSEGEQYGTERLKECINRFKGKPLEEFIEHMATDIEDFIGEAEATDDIAALNIQFV